MELGKKRNYLQKNFSALHAGLLAPLESYRVSFFFWAKYLTLDAFSLRELADKKALAWNVIF